MQLNLKLTWDVWSFVYGKAQITLKTADVSDEFRTNGHVFSKNSRQWAFEHPNNKIHRRGQRYQKGYVCFAILLIVGTYFIEGSWNVHVYMFFENTS